MSKYLSFFADNAKHLDTRKHESLVEPFTVVLRSTGSGYRFNYCLKVDNKSELLLYEIGSDTGRLRETSIDIGDIVGFQTTFKKDAVDKGLTSLGAFLDHVRKEAA
ncbi:MAG: hypothetical protein JJ979_02620 [Roseibium sp.]|nr:hypothetical protein [Roseibium sp.]